MPILKKSFSNTETGDQHPEPYLEDNLEQDVPMEQKLQTLGHFFERVPICMVSTIHCETEELVARCMGLANKDAAGALLYLWTNTESNKTDHIVNDNRVNVTFLIAAAGEWCSISGEASVVTDRDLVAKYYKPSLKNWFGDLNDGVHDGSAKDPRIGLLKVKTTRASYAVVDEGHLGMNIETYKHEGTGKMPRINRQGTITKEDFDERKLAYLILFGGRLGK